MQVSVAVVDDEADLREAVAEYLSGAGMRCWEAADAAELRALAAREPLDVVVLDVTMPGESGLSVARWLRGRGPRPGIILASAAGSQADRVVGLEVGADDYIVKPYELRELLARVRSVARRLPDGATPLPAVDARAAGLPVGDFSLDLQTKILTDGAGVPVDLTAMEGDLLAVLVGRPGRVLSRTQLLELAHGRDGAENERSIDIRVTRLRRKIEPDPENPILIRTVRGSGYVFVPRQG